MTAQEHYNDTGCTGPYTSSLQMMREAFRHAQGREPGDEDALPFVFRCRECGTVLEP